MTVSERNSLLNSQRRTQWSTFDKFWVGSTIILALSISLYTNNGWLATVAAITGVIEPVLSAKGKSINWWVGLITVLAYGYISYENELYGMAFLNLIFYAPLQFVGYYKWKHSENHNDVSQYSEVKVRKLNKKQWFVSFMSSVMLTVLFYILCRTIMPSDQPLLNALIVAISVVGNFVMINRFIEQWYFWLIVNIISIVLWIIVMLQSDTPSEIIPLIIMNIAKIGNILYGIYSWKKIEQRQNKNREVLENSTSSHTSLLELERI